MEEKGREAIAAFDALFTTNRIQMMKIFLSWLPPVQQGGLAIYIKLSELQYTLRFLNQHPGIPLFQGRTNLLSFDRLLDGNLLQEDTDSLVEFLEELLPLASPREREKLEAIRNMLNGFGKMKEMMEMMEMMKELFPEGMNGSGSSSENSTDGGSPLDFLSGMTGMNGMDLSSFSNVWTGANRELIRIKQPI